LEREWKMSEGARGEELVDEVAWFTATTLTITYFKLNLCLFLGAITVL
jgi:hypothetical protein